MLHTEPGKLVLTPYAPPPPQAKITSAPHRATQPKLKWNDDGLSRLLFDFVDYLKQPLIDVSMLPEEFRHSDRRDVAMEPEPEHEEVCALDGPPIDRVAWGDTWLTSQGDLPWSSAAVAYLQYNVFWESMEELSLTDNPAEKWDALKWIFMPAIRKYYVYSKKRSRSHCFEMHESNHPFSFYLCAKRVRMNPDVIREGVRRNIPDELVSAVMKVCTF